LVNFGIVSLACLAGMNFYNRKESEFTDFA
jgi:hypothetical protein